MNRGFQLDVMGATAAEMASLFPALNQVRWHQAFGKNGAVELLFDSGLSLLLHGKTAHEWGMSLARLEVDAEEFGWYLGLDERNPGLDFTMAGLLRKLATYLAPILPSNEPVYGAGSVAAPLTGTLAVASYLR